MKIKRVVKKHAVKKPAAKKATTTPTRGAAKKSAAKKTVTKKTAKKTSPPAKRELNPLTGFSKGTDQDIIATELLAGGNSRGEVSERVAKLLPAKTRTGTAKPISNLVSSVYNNLMRRGYRVEESFKVLPPTPASKAKATRAAKKVASSK